MTNAATNHMNAPKNLQQSTSSFFLRGKIWVFSTSCLLRCGTTVEYKRSFINRMNSKATAFKSIFSKPTVDNSHRQPRNHKTAEIKSRGARMNAAM
eukprot:CAMPEP_0185913138 /NCGR_PEP_ID=MMETSP0196C-20130402/42924_1 /TAXON_ID=2932 /ORGANISM="Alexandrium fundyense, Strain CCMP1719" /LENGTH=95 /DNA_ID=CAMNT_0028634475 /DNA_START=37 /DNA_END=324 /DNA_ORIENTATION=-